MHSHDSEATTDPTSNFSGIQAGELDLYGPNLERTGIFMETPEDDMEFGVLLNMLSQAVTDDNVVKHCAV